MSTILVRTPNWLGDAILSTPAIHALREAFPKAELMAIAHRRVEEIFNKNPDLDYVFVYDPEAEHRGFFQFLRFLSTLREKRVDSSIIFPLSFSSAWMVYLAGARERIGYSTEGRGFLLTKRIPLPPNFKRKHLLDSYLEIILSLGIETRERRLFPPLSFEDEKKAKTLLESEGIKEDKTLIGINPGAKFGPAKRWFKERFILLGKEILHHFSGLIVVFGSSEERVLSEEIARSIGEKAISLAGKTSLGTLAAIVKRCCLFISNDTGPMHLASAVGTPVIAIFGSTSSQWTGPIGERDVVIQEPISCSPCYKRKCLYGHYQCMNLISVDKVYRIVREFLDEKRSV